MKTLIVLLALAFVSPTPRARAQLGPACFAITGIGGGIGLIIYINNRCKPKYWCVRDPESGIQGCRIITPKAAKIEGLQIISGPFVDAMRCDINCQTNRPTGQVSAELNDEPMSPETFIYVEQSSSPEGPWSVVSIVWASPDDEEIELYQTTLSAGAAFFRARY